MKRVTLDDCPVGLFMWKGTACVKTTYRTEDGLVEAYLVETGEFFWGGVLRSRDQPQVAVVPVKLSEILGSNKAEGETDAQS